MPDQQLSDTLRHRIHKEFSRPVLKNWDWQFTRLLGLVILCEVILVTVMVLIPEKEYSQKDIERIQEQYANFIIAQEEREAERLTTVSTGIESRTGETIEETGEEEPPVSEEPSEVTETRRQPGEEPGEGGRRGEEERRTVQRQEAGEIRRRQYREKKSRSVSTKGLLGLLTGSGSAARGTAVDDVLTGSGSSNGVGQDLDQILASVDGLQTQGGQGMGGPSGTSSGIGGVRGSRSGERTSIDDLVAEGSDMATASMSRQGDLYMDSPTDVVGRGSKSAYRSPDAIRQVLLTHVPAVRYCYERELKRNPELKGKISVRITVGPDGNVIDAEILTSTLNNTRVERCIIGRIRHWRDFRAIDPTEGNVTFRQVYTFGV